MSTSSAHSVPAKGWALGSGVLNRGRARRLPDFCALCRSVVGATWWRWSRSSAASRTYFGAAHRALRQTNCFVTCCVRWTLRCSGHSVAVAQSQLLRFPEARRQSSCTTRRRACRQLAHSFGPPSSSSASSSSSVCPALGILQPIHVTASNADGAGHWRRPVPALQREEPVGAGGRDRGICHQADAHLGHQRWPERQLYKVQLTSGCGWAVSLLRRLLPCRANWRHLP